MIKCIQKIIFSLCLLQMHFLFGEKIAVIGSNYVGLATTSVLLHCGHEITCVDIDTQKIDQLKQGKMTIFESKIEEHIFNNSSFDKCSFTNDILEALHSPIIFICIGTPTMESGECDSKGIFELLNVIVQSSKEQKIICVKSSLSPGTMRKLKSVLDNAAVTHHLVYHPEFMRQGSALVDMMEKNPIVLGGESAEVFDRIESLYDGLVKNGIKVIKTNYETAELIKYAWNSFSAIRISYINELAVLCNEFSGDIATLIGAIALSEKLLPTEELNPGPGYGGSCLPKDTKAFATLIEEKGMASSMVHQAIISNERHIQNLIKSIYASLNHSVANKRIAILGLSFKANTDDIRYAPAVEIISALKNDGAFIQAYDPQAIKNMQKIFPDIAYFDSPYDAVKLADCIIVLTDWELIKSIDLKTVALLCHNKIIFDPRNLYDPCLARKLGFRLFNLGRQEH